MKRTELISAIRASNPRSILAIDPDAHTPGAAWCSETREDASCQVWGGNRTGEPLAQPDAVRRLLTTLRPNLVLVEAALVVGGAHARSMHEQNIVRGGWVWLCQLAGVECLLVPPRAYQDPLARRYGQKGPGSRKRAYKQHARELIGDGKPVNEDAAAALCMLDFALETLGASVGKVTRAAA